MERPQLPQEPTGEPGPIVAILPPPDTRLRAEAGARDAYGRRGWRAWVGGGAVVLALAACGSSAASGSGSADSSETGGSQPAAEAPSFAPAPDYTSGQIWDADTGCLMDYAANNDTITASADTNLCRTPDTSITTGAFYDYFARGTGASSWQKIVGQQSDGYTYWMFPDHIWHRELIAGGPEQVKIGFTDGTTEYEDLDSVAVRYATAIPAADFAVEDQNEVAILNEGVATDGTNPQSPAVAQAELATARQGVSAENQAMAQLEQNYQIAVANAGNGNAVGGQQVSNSELEFLAQENGKEVRVNTEKDCTDDDRVMDGC